MKEDQTGFFRNLAMFVLSAMPVTVKSTSGRSTGVSFSVQIDTEIICQSELLQERGNIVAFSEASHEDLDKKAPVAWAQGVLY